MSGDNPGSGPCMVVVGDRQSEFVRTAIGLAEERSLEAVVCDDLWMAVAETARANGRCLLVVGALEALSAEEGRFFRIAAARRIRCCCVLRASAVHERSGLLHALRAGAAVVSQEDLRDVLGSWLAVGGGHHSRRTSSGIADDELRPTREELIALLGPETDA